MTYLQTMMDGPGLRCYLSKKIRGKGANDMSIETDEIVKETLILDIERNINTLEEKIQLLTSSPELIMSGGDDYDEDSRQHILGYTKEYVNSYRKQLNRLLQENGNKEKS